MIRLLIFGTIMFIGIISKSQSFIGDKLFMVLAPQNNSYSSSMQKENLWVEDMSITKYKEGKKNGFCIEMDSSFSLNKISLYELDKLIFLINFNDSVLNIDTINIANMGKYVPGDWKYCYFNLRVNDIAIEINARKVVIAIYKNERTNYLLYEKQLYEDKFEPKHFFSMYDNRLHGEHYFERVYIAERIDTLTVFARINYKDGNIDGTAAFYSNSKKNIIFEVENNLITKEIKFPESSIYDVYITCFYRKKKNLYSLLADEFNEFTIFPKHYNIESSDYNRYNIISNGEILLKNYGLFRFLD